MEKRLSATCRTASFALAGYCEARANGGAYLRHRERHTARRPGPRENRHRKAYRTEEFSTIRETVHGTRANERRQGIPDGGIRTETQYGLRPGIRGLGRTDSGRHTGRRNSARYVRRCTGRGRTNGGKAYRTEVFGPKRNTACGPASGASGEPTAEGIPDGGIRAETQYGVRPDARGLGRTDTGRHTGRRHSARYVKRCTGRGRTNGGKAYRTEEFSTIRETVHGTQTNERRQGIPDGGIRAETQYGVQPDARGLGRTDSGRHTGRRNSGRNAIRRAARHPGPRET